MSEPQAEASRPPWINHFHIIIPHASGSAILMLPAAEGWHLPYARGEGIWLSETKRIIALLHDALQLDFPFTILRHLAFEPNEQERWDRVLFVMEPAAPLDAPPLGGQWIDRATLESLPFALPDQRALLLTYLTEDKESGTPTQIDPRRAPWARPGWFATAAAWIEQALREEGYTQSGPVEQLRNWSISSLLVAPTTTGKLYFKAAATLPLFVNEPALTQTLAELYPGSVPLPVKIDQKRRWMLMQDFDQVPWDNDNIDLAPILRAYGTLQRDSANHVEKLMDAGCIDRRLSVLASQIDPLFADPATQRALTPEEYTELLALAPALKVRCAELATYNLPTTLLHGDLHLGNITQTAIGGYLFFDWTDAALSFPFLDLFLLYFDFGDHASYATWRDAYLDAWAGYEPPARLHEAWELAKPLCALHHAISYLSIVNHIEPITREELAHGHTDNLQRLLTSM